MMRSTGNAMSLLLVITVRALLHADVCDAQSHNGFEKGYFLYQAIAATVHYRARHNHISIQTNISIVLMNLRIVDVDQSAYDTDLCQFEGPESGFMIESMSQCYLSRNTVHKNDMQYFIFNWHTYRHDMPEHQIYVIQQWNSTACSLWKFASLSSDRRNYMKCLDVIDSSYKEDYIIPPLENTGSVYLNLTNYDLFLANEKNDADEEAEETTAPSTSVMPMIVYNNVEFPGYFYVIFVILFVILVSILFLLVRNIYRRTKCCEGRKRRIRQANRCQGTAIFTARLSPVSTPLVSPITSNPPSDNLFKNAPMMSGTPSCIPPPLPPPNSEKNMLSARVSPLFPPTSSSSSLSSSLSNIAKGSISRYPQVSSVDELSKTSSDHYMCMQPSADGYEEFAVKSRGMNDVELRKHSPKEQSNMLPNEDLYEQPSALCFNNRTYSNNRASSYNNMLAKSTETIIRDIKNNAIGKLRTIPRVREPSILSQSCPQNSPPPPPSLPLPMNSICRKSEVKYIDILPPIRTSSLPKDECQYINRASVVLNTNTTRPTNQCAVRGMCRELRLQDD